MLFETNTFTTGERESKPRGYSLSSILIDIHYCSYCGQRAIREDVGYTHNHRWEEEIIHYCNCDDAKQEMQTKEIISNLKSELYKQEEKLEKMKKKTDNSIVNNIKFESELKKLKDKYKITEK